MTAPVRPAPPVDLDAIRARLDAITPGEWRSQYDKVWNDRFLRVIVEDNPYGFPAIITASIPSVADAEFIAHAPSDIRALVAEVERRSDSVVILDQLCDFFHSRIQYKGDMDDVMAGQCHSMLARLIYERG